MMSPYRRIAARPEAGAPAEAGSAGAGHVLWRISPFAMLLAYGLWLRHEGLLTRWFDSTSSAVAVATLLVVSMGAIALGCVSPRR